MLATQKGRSNPVRISSNRWLKLISPPNASAAIVLEAGKEARVPEIFVALLKSSSARWGICGGKCRAATVAQSLVFIAILTGNVVFRHFVSVNFALVRVAGILNALDDFGLERVSFFEQFVNALRIRAREVGQSL